MKVPHAVWVPVLLTATTIGTLGTVVMLVAEVETNSERSQLIRLQLMEGRLAHHLQKQKDAHYQIVQLTASTLGGPGATVMSPAEMEPNSELPQSKLQILMAEMPVHHLQKLKDAHYQVVQLTATTPGAHGAHVMSPAEVETGNEQSQ